MNTPFNRDPHIFNAPELAGIVKRAIDFFSNTPLYEFPPRTRMHGTGVYGLYYFGDFPPYAPIAEKNRLDGSQPIYIGQAANPGRRTGIEGNARSIWARLVQHAGSIRMVQNLNMEDFKCRFMFLENDEHDLIGAVETGLIKAFRPLWNSRIVDGFGNHDPGKGRYNQQPSQWDTLHPGRLWVKNLVGESRDPVVVAADIKRFLEKSQLLDFREPETL